MYKRINTAIVADIPTCAKRIAPSTYFKAVRCNTYEEAYRYLLKIEDRLPIPLVKPWKRAKSRQQKFLATTSRYSRGQSCPICALEFVEHPTCICG